MYKTLPQNFVQVDGGMYQFARFVFGVSRKLGAGNLLYGGEAYHDGGPWVHPDNFYKFNGLATYSQGDDTSGFSITARGYAGTRWNSSDQLPYTALATTAPAGQMGNYTGFFGTLDSTDGGHSHRYSLQGEWHHRTANSETRIMAYGFYYDLNLFSDFTYYLVDPYKGDQFEQQDRRWVAGFDIRHTIFGEWYGRKVETTFGLQLRNDWIHNGLFRSSDRVRTDKTYYTVNYSDNGWSSLDQIAVLPAATDLNKFTETIGSPSGLQQDPVGEKTPLRAGCARRLRQGNSDQLFEPHESQFSQRSLSCRCQPQFRPVYGASFCPVPKQV